VSSVNDLILTTTVLEAAIYYITVKSVTIIENLKYSLEKIKIIELFWLDVFFSMFKCLVMFVYVLFYLGQLSHFPSSFGTGVTNLNEPPSSFLLLPHYCGLGAGSIHFRAIVNNK